MVGFVGCYSFGCLVVGCHFGVRFVVGVEGVPGLFDWGWCLLGCWGPGMALVAGFFEIHFQSPGSRH